VVLGANPPQLDCCDLLSEIKGSEQTHHIRVVMLSPGGSAERSRGLDLGADDVLSLPFDSHELLSRVRSQLRDKSVAEWTSRAVAPLSRQNETSPLGVPPGGDMAIPTQYSSRITVPLPPEEEVRKVIGDTYDPHKSSMFFRCLPALAICTSQP
jgi:DNA-binding NarL/FixJ family response regulator